MIDRVYLPDFALKRYPCFFIGYTTLLTALIIFDGIHLPNFTPKKHLYFFADCMPLLAISVISVKEHLACVMTIFR